MAEPVNNLNNPSPTHSANSEPILTGKPPTKRTAAATSAVPPPKRKRPHNSEETKDTASSVPKNQVNDDDLLPDDLDVYQELEAYEIRHGGNPAQDRYHMERFYFTYVFLGVGNDAAWEAKFRRLRDKFKDVSEESVLPEQMEEFLLWKKMFERVPDA